MKKIFFIVVLSSIALISCGRKSDLTPLENAKRPRFDGVSDEMKSNPEFEKKMQSQNPIYQRKTSK